MKKKSKRRSNIASAREKRKSVLPSKKESQNIYIHIGYYYLVFSSYFKELGNKADELRNMTTESAIGTFLSVLNPPCTFSNLESIDILLSLKKALEDRIADIISKHSIYYWIHLYRRLAPANTFRHESLVSVRLYRETMETAFVKYGRPEIGNDLVMGTNLDPQEVMSGEVERIDKELGIKAIHSYSGIFIKEFSMSHFLELLSLERLVSEYCHVIACLRRAYKGGNLIVENMEEYHVLNDNVTESLIQSVDKRNEKFGTTATDKGIPIGSPHYDYAKMGAICMLPIYNVERETLEDYPQDRFWNIKWSELLEPRNKMAPNFVFLPIDMYIYYLRHQFLGTVFVKEYGFSLECFVQCAMALFYLTIYKSVESHGLVGSELMQRAYLAYTSLEKIANDINSTILGMSKLFHDIPQIGAYRTTIDDIFSFLKRFVLDPAQRENVDLGTRSPRPLIIETWPGNYLVDYAAILSILFSAVSFEFAELGGKGLIFEDYVIEKLTNNGFKLWEHQKILKARDGTQKEIDISFLLGTAMFICECRSISMSRAYERGEKDALKFRRAKFESALKDCDTLAGWLSRHRLGTNFEVPQDISIIIPIAVSPFVEYIWSADEALWLTREIPRVCTPDELASITDRAILSEIVKRHFVQYMV
ncbi:MAG: hypothetical protein WCA51_06505 [Dehalococcoidia bacterium]